MNKAWITGIALAGVAGSAGAAFAGIASDNQAGPQVEAQGLVAETTTTETAAQTATYQVGAAGTVTLTADDGALTVVSATAGEFWTLGAFASPAAHVEVPFNDAAQQVTFIADLVNGEIVVSVTNVPVPGATPTSIEVTQITTGTTTAGTVAAPQPATPAAAKPIAVAVPTPGSSHTTSQSSAGASGGHDDDDHESDDSHEESHENENEGDDD